MMKKKCLKNSVVILLIAVLLFLITACGNPKNAEDQNSIGNPKNTEDQNSIGNQNSAEKKQTAGEKTASDENNSKTRTITDARGRKVEIPAEVDSIVPLGNTPRMIVYLGLADKVVGIGECEIAKSPIQAYAYVHKEKWEKLPVCGTDAMGETAFYPEEIITADPDVILCTYTADVADNIQNQTGIPVVSVMDATLFSKEYEDAFRILGDVCGVSKRAEEVAEYIHTCLADLEKRTKDVPDEKKPSVLGAGATFKGSHGIEGVYSQYPVFKAIAANDAAAGISDTEGGLLVDKEKIIEWNPDMIFFDFGSLELIRQDYKENPDYYAQLKAVKNGELYQWPNSTWHWSNVEIPLVSAYSTAKLLYPEEFADVDFEKKAAEIFEFFLGDKEYLKKLEAAGAGYSKITLEE
ncbi:MAG: ABC transporter substrate-binding protein [Lachnospiraceae bacterium]|nr:ABC transporter substrate-binding protein [Lachnospiraceae bacterium]